MGAGHFFLSNLFNEISRIYYVSWVERGVGTVIVDSRTFWWIVCFGINRILHQISAKHKQIHMSSGCQGVSLGFQGSPQCASRFYQLSCQELNKFFAGLYFVLNLLRMGGCSHHPPNLCRPSSQSSRSPTSTALRHHQVSIFPKRHTASLSALFFEASNFFPKRNINTRVAFFPKLPSRGTKHDVKIFSPFAREKMFLAVHITRSTFCRPPSYDLTSGHGELATYLS